MLRIGLALPVVGIVLVIMMIGALGGTSGNAAGTTPSMPSDVALADIPANYLQLYRAAGAEKGIGWEYIAAVGKIESDHGRSSAIGVREGSTNFHGCCAGPMQFCVRVPCEDQVGPQTLTVAQAQAGTWATRGVDGNGDNVKNPWDPADAIPAAAGMLAVKAPADWRGALLAYNNSEVYVTDVITQAAAYRRAEAAQAQYPSGSGDGRAVIANPRIDFADETPEHEADIAAGRIDGRILAVMTWISTRHTMTVSSMRVDHDKDGGNHPAGRAIDIGIVDGKICRGARNDACGDLAVELAQIPGALHSSELIYCFDPDGPDNLGSSDDAWAQSDHCDHIHFGYDN